MAFDLAPVWISLKTSLAATAVALVLGVAAAEWRERKRRAFGGLLDSLCLLPLILPPTVVGFFLLLLFGRNGPLGRLLLHFGAVVVFSWPATVIAATVVSFPLVYITARGAFAQIEPGLADAARTLGASEWRVFRRVTLPLAAPGIFAGTTLAFARALGEFGATVMLAGDIPGRTETLPLAIYFDIAAGQMRQAFGDVTVVLIVSLAVLLALGVWARAERRRRIPEK
jgi:molybdate transport system permease protein